MMRANDFIVATTTQKRRRAVWIHRTADRIYDVKNRVSH